MTRYLIEVPHGSTKAACDRAIRVFMETGFHFMTNADWGCGDGVHKAWFIVDTGSKDEARNLLPTIFRQSATIIALEQFKPQDYAGLRGEHEG